MFIMNDFIYLSVIALIVFCCIMITRSKAKIRAGRIEERSNYRAQDYYDNEDGE